MKVHMFCAVMALHFLLASQVQGKWIRLASKNFELLTNAGESAGRETLRNFEQICHLFETQTDRRTLSPLPVRIYVFKSEADFEPFQVQTRAAGYYQSGPDRDYIAMCAAGPDRYRVIFHEYVHLVLKHAGVRVPVWFNEGTAELYSTVRFRNSTIHIGDLIQSHVLALRANKMLDIGSLLEVDHQSPHYNERGKSGIFYAQSWALVHMLNFSDEYQPGLAKFLGMILEGEPQVAALRQAFGKTESQVLADLDRYMQIGRFSGVEVRGANGVNVEEISPVPLEKIEAELLLGDLLLAIRRDEEAAKRYTRLSAVYADRWEIQAALGDLAVRRGEESKARTHYEKAIEMGSQGGRVYYDHALMLKELGEPEDKVLASLRRAVELHPDLFDAQHLLGYLSLRNHRLPEAVHHLRRAAGLQPFRASVWESLALAYHYSGNREKARAAAKRARKVAGGPEEIARTEAMIHMIDAGEPFVASGGGTEQDNSREGSGPPKTGRVEGALTQVDCLGPRARLHVVGQGRKHFLLVQDPSLVRIRNTDGVSVEFTCGPIKGRPVIVEFKPNPKVTYGTAGDVSSIEFR